MTKKEATGLIRRILTIVENKYPCVGKQTLIKHIHNDYWSELEDIKAMINVAESNGFITIFEPKSRLFNSVEEFIFLTEKGKAKLLDSTEFKEFGV